MPRVNGIKHSKSELIHMLLDKRTRTEALSAVLKSNGVRLPKVVLFGKNYDPELCKKDLLANKHEGFYSYFSIRKSPKIGSDLTALIKDLMLETNKRLFKLMKKPDFPKIPATLAIENDMERVFYLSMLIIQDRSPKTEHSLLYLLYRLIGSAPSGDILKNCKVKFSKNVIKEFIQSNVCEIQRCYRFLSLIAHKLPENVVELWFENDFDVCDEIFSRLNSVRMSEGTCFNKSVFEDLIKFKSFRKAVFNSPLNDEFVMSMAEYASRPDFDYFYRTMGVRKRPSSLSIRPKDAVEYEFFDTISNERLMHSNIIKIRNYQIKHGNTPALSSFVSEHLPRLLGFIEEESLLEDIIVSAIEHNNLSNSATAAHINDTIFEELRKKEDVFRRVVRHFKHPKDKALFDLITGSFGFGIECAKQYINLGYEEELMEYFRVQSVSDCISIADDWNKEFLAKVFIRKTPYSLSDARLLLDFACANYGLASTPDVLDHVLDVDSDEIFECLPENLKVVYMLRHQGYASRFVDSVNPETCTLQQASQMFEVTRSSGGKALSAHNFYYRCAASDDFEFDELHIVKSLFECCYIRRDESKYLFVKYFDKFIEEIVQSYSRDEIIACTNRAYDFGDLFHFRTCGRDRIAQSLRRPFDFDRVSQVSFVLKLGLKDKYTTFILFDKLISMLSEGSSSHRILALGFVNPSSLCKTHILRYINTLIPLLNNSNAAVCRLSKASLNMITVETREIQNILPEIVQSFVSREYFPVFLASFRSILFNNYLCFNSLNILVQLMFKYLDDYTKDTLFILSKVVNIIKDKDMKHVSGLIFSRISKFVVSHNFYTKEALEVSGQFCLYTKFSDFDVLLQSIASMRISSYLVGVLKIRNDTKLNNQIISHILCNRNGASAVEPSFVAAVSELEEFTQYLDQFLPILKTLFRDDKAEIRSIAAKAFKHILERPNIGSYACEIRSFLLDCAANEDYPIRLLCLDVLDYLPIIYVLRNDQHSLVRKKAQDIWKGRIHNTNKALKNLYEAILGLVEFSDNKVFRPALQGAVRDMAAKYTLYLESYVKNNHTKVDINEFILIEALKVGKMPDVALEFCKSNFSVDVFKLLYKITSFRSMAASSLETRDLVRACHGDCELAFELYSNTRDPVYLGFLSTVQRIGLIRSHYQSFGYVSESNEDMIFTLQSIESCSSVESALVKIHPTYSYHYLLSPREDHGSLNSMFERVFESCHGVDKLVSERNIRYIKNCSIDRIQNKIRLLALFLGHEDKKSFEKVVYLIRESGFDKVLEQDLIFEIMGYLLRNYLSANRRADSYDCIVIMYEKYRESMGFFKQIILTSVLNH